MWHKLTHHLMLNSANIGFSGIYARGSSHPQMTAMLYRQERTKRNSGQKERQKIPDELECQTQMQVCVIPIWPARSFLFVRATHPDYGTRSTFSPGIYICKWVCTGELGIWTWDRHRSIGLEQWKFTYMYLWPARVDVYHSCDSQCPWPRLTLHRACICMGFASGGRRSANDQISRSETSVSRSPGKHSKISHITLLETARHSLHSNMSLTSAKGQFVSLWLVVSFHITCAVPPVETSASTCVEPLNGGHSSVSSEVSHRNRAKCAWCDAVLTLVDGMSIRFVTWNCLWTTEMARNQLPRTNRSMSNYGLC